MGRPPQPGVQFKLRLEPRLREMLDEAAAQNRRTLSAEITERLELSFASWADPQAVHRAYESGRRDALLSSDMEADDSLDFRDEAQLDAKVLFDGLPPKDQRTAINLLRILVDAAALRKPGDG